jgi:hypothetical protein
MNTKRTIINITRLVMALSRLLAIACVLMVGMFWGTYIEHGRVTDMAEERTVRDLNSILKMNGFRMYFERDPIDKTISVRVISVKKRAQAVPTVN